MKLLLCLFATFGVSAFAATAPDSIAGKVYHETSLVILARTSGEKTIVFGADGRFIAVKAGVGNASVPGAPYKIFLAGPSPDGSYTYQRTSDATATIELNFDDGTKATMKPTFTSATGGNDGTPIPSLVGYTFFLTDLAALQNAPANNVSMRGHVDSGHPLIVGFIVPGVQQREVLIRAVGPSLAAFGVTGVWADPDFQLYNGSLNVTGGNEVHYADWTVPPFNFPAATTVATEAAFRKIFSYVGAFPLISGSKDAADVVRLSPGAYTIVCNAGAGDNGGDALIEVYFVP